MYYLYKKLPKKLRQLKELCDLHEKSEFVEGGYQPKESFSYFTELFISLNISILCENN